MKATARDHVLIIYVTKQIEMDTDSGDRPAHTEIKITPEMVEAGVKEFFASVYDQVDMHGPITPREMVSCIIYAALNPKIQR